VPAPGAAGSCESCSPTRRVLAARIGRAVAGHRSAHDPRGRLSSFAKYSYLYGAVSPEDGACVYLIMPTSNTACFQAFLDTLARRFSRQDMLVVPNNIKLLSLPPYSPELNPKENLWDEMREKIFKNYALKSMDAVRAKLKQAVLYMERNPKLVRSITSFPISPIHSDIELL
jgi:hypothetical protein